MPSRQRRRTRRPETAAPRSRTCRCEARGVCVRARAHTSVCFPLFLSLSLARWRARYLVLSLSFPLSRSHYSLSACVRACVRGCPIIIPSLALRANLGVRARQILWAFKRGQVEPPECCLLNSRPRAYFQGAVDESDAFNFFCKISELCLILTKLGCLTCLCTCTRPETTWTLNPHGRACVLSAPTSWRARE